MAIPKGTDIGAGVVAAPSRPVTATATATTPTTRGGGSSEGVLSPVTQWDVLGLQYGLGMAQLGNQLQINRENLAMQKAIAEMENAYNYAVLAGQREDAAKDYALKVGQQVLQQQLATGWLQSTPVVTYDANGKVLVNQPSGTWQPSLDWQAMAGYTYGPTGQQTGKTLQREQAEGQLGLQYLQYLGSLRGPRDYYQYQNVLRAAQGTQLPAWAQALGNQMQTAGFQAPSGALPGYWNAPQPTAGAAQAQPSWAPAPNILPHQVNIAQWNKLLPSEQQMALGAAEQNGWDANDWLAMMQKAAPTGKVSARTTWLA